MERSEQKWSSQKPAQWVAIFAFLLFGPVSLPADGPASASQPTLFYSSQHVKEIPWSIHIVKLNRRAASLRWITTMGQGDALGMAVLSEQVKRVSASAGRPLAAINGDFYRTAWNYPGDPEGVQIVNGELVSAPSQARSCLWVEASGAFHMTNVTPNFRLAWPDDSTASLLLNCERPSDGLVLYTRAIGSSTRTTAGTEMVLEAVSDGSSLPLSPGTNFTFLVVSVNAGGNSPVTPERLVLSAGPSFKLPRLAPGAKLRLSTATVPDMRGATAAIGGGPALVRDGKALLFKGIQFRHPRSAIGWNSDFAFLVEVDGRQQSSAGMTLSELATFMAGLGCAEALNLDGGGSAALWVNGSIVNTPSEGKERPSANAVVVLEVSPKSSAGTSSPLNQSADPLSLNHEISPFPKETLK